jgi:hypothetical protein
MRKELAVAWAESTESCDAEMNRGITLVDDGRLDEAAAVAWRVHVSLTRRAPAPAPSYGAMVDVLVAELPSCGATVRDKVLANACNLGKVFQLMAHTDHAARAWAEKLLSAAVACSRAAFGMEHNVTLLACASLACCFVAHGNLAGAELLQRDLVQTQTRVLGATHPLTMQTTSDLAACLARKKEFGEAERIRRALLEVQRRVLGREHPATLSCTMHLATCLSEMGELREADELMREVLAARRRAFGDAHAETLMVSAALGLNVARMGRLEEAEHVVRGALGAHGAGNALAVRAARSVLASVRAALEAGH